jgi:hypothetical protein
MLIAFEIRRCQGKDDRKTFLRSVENISAGSLAQIPFKISTHQDILVEDVKVTPSLNKKMRIKKYRRKKKKKKKKLLSLLHSFPLYFPHFLSNPHLGPIS